MIRRQTLRTHGYADCFPRCRQLPEALLGARRPAPRALFDEKMIAMRILMVAPQPFFRARGTPFSVLHRIRALLSLGHTVELVTYPFGETPLLPGLTIRRAGRPPGVRDVSIGPSLTKLVLDLSLVAMTWRRLAAGGIDLLHTHEEAGLIGAWMGRRFGVPHLYDMHSSLPQQFANFGRYDWRPVVRLFERIERYTLEHADGVIAICPALGEHLSSVGYGGPSAVIENTLDFEPPSDTEEDVRELRARHRLGNAPVVVYTGTLEQYQGLDLLVQASVEVLRRVPDARFLVVGGEPGQLDRLRRDAEAAGSGGAFVFEAAVPPQAVFPYLRAASVLVTCRTRGTNTPLKIYQYLRAGRPIVATSIPSHTQVLDHTTAELVPPTAAGVAEGLARVLSDPVRSSALAGAAARLAAERYGERQYVEALADLLGRIRPATARPLAMVG